MVYALHRWTSSLLLRSSRPQALSRHVLPKLPQTSEALNSPPVAGAVALQYSLLLARPQYTDLVTSNTLLDSVEVFGPASTVPKIVNLTLGSKFGGSSEIIIVLDLYLDGASLGVSRGLKRLDSI